MWCTAFCHGSAPAQEKLRRGTGEGKAQHHPAQIHRAFVRHQVQEGFVRPEHEGLMLAESDPVELIRRLRAAAQQYGIPLADWLDLSTGIALSYVASGSDRSVPVILLHAWGESRGSFDRLVALLCAGEVGAVLCFDASRLARNGRDWHHLLELCGLVEARGDGKGRSYHLSAVIYRRLGDKSAYIHQRGFEPIQQEQMVLQYLQKHGSISRSEIAQLYSSA